MPKNYVIKIITDATKLSTRAEEINVGENLDTVSKVVNELKDTMDANPSLMALSAPQIGYPYRIFCVRFSDGYIKTFINPLITKIQGRVLMIEKSPFNSDEEYLMQRPERILIGYQTATGRVETDLSIKYPLSTIVDQMLDLIDGILYEKYFIFGWKIDEEYYKAPQEEKDEFNNWYINTYLVDKNKSLEEVAKNDEDITKLLDTINFITSVYEGKTEVVPVEKNGELDFDNSSQKSYERCEKFRKDYENIIKKKFGIK